jgi:hypothetical protein
MDIVLFGSIAIVITNKITAIHTKAFFLNCAAALFVGFYVNTVFYDEIIPYKGQVAAAKYINQKPFDGFHLYSLKAENNIFQFYCKRPVDLVPIGQFKSFKPAEISVFYVNQQSMDYLIQTHAGFKIIRSFVNYPKENLTPDFINKATRFKTLDHVYMVTK